MSSSMHSKLVQARLQPEVNPPPCRQEMRDGGDIVFFNIVFFLLWIIKVNNSSFLCHI